MFTLRGITVVTALFFVCAASSYVFAADAVEARTCTVTGVVGGVQVRYSPGYNREKAAAKGLAAPVSGSISGEWSDLRQNMTVGANCEIRTGAGSEVRFETAGGAVLRVEENTHIEIAVLQAVTKKPKDKGGAPEAVLNAKFKLFYGGIIGNVKKIMRGDKPDVTFETPTATAAIRGTVIEVEAVKGANTLIRAFDGVISVAPAGSKRFVDVGDGKMTELAPKQKDVVVKDVPAGYKRKGLLLKGEKAPAPIEEGRKSVGSGEAVAVNNAPDPESAAVAPEGMIPLEDDPVAVQEDYRDDAVDADAVAPMPMRADAPVGGAQPVQAVAEPAPPIAPAPAVAAHDDGVPSGEEVSNGGAAGDQPVAAEKDGDRADKAAGKSGGSGEEGGSAPLFAKPDFELSLGMATVNGQPWTRIAIGADIPIWKFGVFLDLELFIDNESKVSNKGWDFKDNAAEAIFRKIRYIRYGREDEPLFVKFGGLSNVTIGYGMIVDRFTNMLRYPDEKLLGLQFYLNDVFPIGLTVQTLISDFAEVKDDGGVYAARVAVRPLKTTGIFLLDGLSVGGMYAADANVHAPAKKWGYDGEVKMLVAMRQKYKDDNPAFFDEYKEFYRDYYKTQGIDKSIDTILSVYDREDTLRSQPRSFALYGIDAGLPIIKTDLLGVELYGQSAVRADKVVGWGIGAPGVAVKVWKLTGNVEYRKVEGRFAPGYFDTYYLDERYSRGLMRSKDEYIDNVSLNGVFGRVGLDMFGVLNIGGSYQHMIGGKDGDGNTPKSRSYEATAGVGEAIMSRIPKFNLAEAYVRNANVGIYDKYGKSGNVELGKNGIPEKAGLFDRSPGMYWGYRAGFEITAGASLIWDYRYGWKVENGKLVPDNHMLLQTALRF